MHLGKTHETEEKLVALQLLLENSSLLQTGAFSAILKDLLKSTLFAGSYICLACYPQGTRKTHIQTKKLKKGQNSTSKGIICT